MTLQVNPDKEPRSAPAPNTAPAVNRDTREQRRGLAEQRPNASSSFGLCHRPDHAARMPLGRAARARRSGRARARRWGGPLGRDSGGHAAGSSRIGTIMKAKRSHPGVGLRSCPPERDCIGRSGGGRKEASWPRLTPLLTTPSVALLSLGRAFEPRRRPPTRPGRLETPQNQSRRFALCRSGMAFSHRGGMSRPRSLISPLEGFSRHLLRFDPLELPVTTPRGVEHGSFRKITPRWARGASIARNTVSAELGEHRSLRGGTRRSQPGHSQAPSLSPAVSCVLGALRFGVPPRIRKS